MGALENAPYAKPDMTHLDSLTVLSLEQATTLPYMTLKLVMDGMRVIRLESPPRGDPNRWVGPQELPSSNGGTSFESGIHHA